MGARAQLRGLGFLSSLIPVFWWEYEQSHSSTGCWTCCWLQWHCQVLCRQFVPLLLPSKHEGNYHPLHPQLSWDSIPAMGMCCGVVEPSCSVLCYLWLSRNPEYFLQDIHGMISPCCKDAHRGFSLGSPRAVLSPVGQRHRVPAASRDAISLPSALRCIQKHFQVFCQERFPGPVLPVCPGWCEHGRVSTGSVQQQQEGERTAHRFIESHNILRWKGLWKSSS